MRTVTAAPLTITVAEAARRIGCSRWRLYRLIQEGNFPPAIHMGGSVAVNVEKLSTYVDTGGVR
jgi:excisionase family DNA binding protein